MIDIKYVLKYKWFCSILSVRYRFACIRYLLGEGALISADQL